MARSRISKARRYSPRMGSTRRSYKKRSTPSGKAFWPISRRMRNYRFTRYAPEAVILSAGGGTAVAPVVGGAVTVGSQVADLNSANQAFGLQMTFTLDTLPNYTEFTTLFDKYRITGVELEFFFNANIASTATGALGPMSPTVTFAIDHDDANVPSTYEVVAQHDTARTVTLTDGLIHRVKVPFPRVATTVFNSLITSGYAQGKAGQWIDCNSASVPHYGLKGWVTGFPIANANSAAIRIRAKYYVETSETI